MLAIVTAFWYLASMVIDRFGDQRLQHAFVLLVAGEERLVSEHEHGIAQVGIEAADQVLGVRDVHAMLTKQPDQPVAQRALARALLAAEHQGHFARLAGCWTMRASHPMT